MIDKKRKKNKINNSVNNYHQMNYKYGRNGIIFPGSRDYQDNDEIMFSEFDPFGSYTGISENDLDKPIQDADDL